MSTRETLLSALRAVREADGSRTYPDTVILTVLAKFEAQAMRQAAGLIDTAEPGCQCGDCSVSRANAATIRQEADLVEGVTR